MDWFRLLRFLRAAVWCRSWTDLFITLQKYADLSPADAAQFWYFVEEIEGMKDEFSDQDMAVVEMRSKRKNEIVLVAHGEDSKPAWVMGFAVDTDGTPVAFVMFTDGSFACVGLSIIQGVS